VTFGNIDPGLEQAQKCKYICLSCHRNLYKNVAISAVTEINNYVKKTFLELTTLVYETVNFK
jgi:hypothetical protein